MSWGRLLTVRKVDFQSTNGSSTLLDPTIYAYNENADRARICNKCSEEDVLVSDSDFYVVGTKFMSLRGGM